MTQLASLSARITGDSSGFVKAATSAEAAAKKVTTATGGTGAAGAGGMAGALGKTQGALSKVSGSRSMRMLPMQFSQVAQQAAAGTPVLRALTIQAADIGLAFGTVGTILGIVATVAMPAIISMFSGAGEEADKLSDRIDDFASSLGRATSAAEIAATPIDELREKYGQFAEEVQRASRIVAQAEVAQAMREFGDIAIGLQSQLGGVTSALDEYTRQAGLANEMQRNLGERTVLNAAAWDEADAAVDRARESVVAAAAEMGLTAGQADRLRNALDLMGTAEGPQEIAAAAGEALDMLNGMFTTSQNIPPEIAKLIAHLRTVQTETANAATQMDELRIIAASMGDSVSGGRGAGPAGMRGRNLSGDIGDDDDDKPTRGGGGSAARDADTFEKDLERLRDQLATELEVEQSMHDQRNEMLRKAKENDLLTQEEYDGYMERENKRHAQEMAAIDAYRYGDSTQQMGQFMGEMATAFASGNEQMMQIAKVFGAGEALINAWRAYGQVMADPSLPWFAKIPAAVSLFGSAVQAVSAIQGVGKGGSGKKTAGGGGAPAAGAPEAAGGGGAQRPAVNLTLIGDGNFSRAQIVQLTEAINDSGDEGQKAVQIRGRR